MGFDFEKHELCLAWSNDKLSGLYMARNPSKGCAASLDEQTDNSSPEYLRFWDLQRERMFEICEVLQNDEHEFGIKTVESIEMKIWPMTIAGYNEHIKPILDTPLVFSTESEMKNHFLNIVP